MRGISSFHFIAHQNHFSSHFKELCCAKSLIDLYNVNHNTDFVSLVANIVWLEVNMCCSSNVLMRTKHTRLILTISCAVCPSVFFQEQADWVSLGQHHDTLYTASTLHWPEQYKLGARLHLGVFICLSSSAQAHF